jgi:hypothetical protein
MEFLYSIAIVAVFWVFVSRWSKQAQKDQQKSRYPSANRKTLVIAALVFLSSCVSSRFVPTNRQPAKLVKVIWLSHGRALLEMITMEKDTARYFDNSPSMQRRTYHINQWYIIKYDSTKYRITEGKKYYRAILN